MKKVLLLTLCVLIALPSLGMAAGSLRLVVRPSSLGSSGLPPTGHTHLDLGCGSLLTGDTIIGEIPFPPAWLGNLLPPNLPQ